jgi:hypothetical protein
MLFRPRKMDAAVGASPPRRRLFSGLCDGLGLAPGEFSHSNSPDLWLRTRGTSPERSGRKPRNSVTTTSYPAKAGGTFSLARCATVQYLTYCPLWLTP